MKSIRQLCAKPIIGLCLFAFPGCGSSQNGTPLTATENAPTSQSSSSVEPGTSTGSSSKAEEAPSTSSATAQAQPAAAPVVKPTAEQLAHWKFASFTPLQLLAYHENEKGGFAFFITPTNDGKQYLIGGTKLTLWSTSGKEPSHELIPVITEDDQRLLSFAVSPDGSWCVAGSADGLLRKFDLAGRKEITPSKVKTDDVVRLAISPDGKEIATVPYVSEVTIWDADTLKKKSSFKLDANDIKHLQYIAPGVLIACGETMSTWDTASGNKIKTYPSSKYQSTVALSPDGKELVFGTDDFVQRWNLAGDIASGEYHGVPNRDAAVRFTSDGKLIAFVSGDAVRILDAASGQLLQIIESSGSKISDVSWIPQKQTLLIADDDGRTRIWGRADDTKDLDLSPLVAPVVVASTEPGTPATSAESLAMLDLRLLPKVPGSRSQSGMYNSMNYSAPVNAEEAKTFVRYILAERGWKEVTSQATPYSIPFEKNGYALTFSAYEEKPTSTMVSLSYLGNYDSLKVPRLTEFLKSTTYEGATSVIYKVSASLLQIETELLKQLHQAGWTSVVRLNRSHQVDADGRDFEFIKNGSTAHITVQRDNDDKSLYVISNSVSLAPHSLPIPPDAGVVEWDDYFEAQLVANTSLSLQEATAFYEDNMKKQGWMPLEKGRRIDKKIVYLPYYSGQSNVAIALKPIADGLVRINAGKYSDDSWQKLEEKEAKDAPPATEPAETDGVEAADLPLLHVVETPLYDADAESIRFLVDQVSLKDLAKEYSDLLEKQGWTTEASGEPADDSLSLRFKKGSNTLYYDSSTDPLGKKSVRFNGNGLLWKKKRENKQLISYSNWLRDNKYPASLKRLSEYQAQMEQLLAKPKK